MELYKIKVVKEDGKVYYDLYAVWYFRRVRYERVLPTFKGISWKILFARAIKAENVQEMKALYLKKFESVGD